MHTYHHWKIVIYLFVYVLIVFPLSCCVSPRCKSCRRWGPCVAHCQNCSAQHDPAHSCSAHFCGTKREKESDREHTATSVLFFKGTVKTKNSSKRIHLLQFKANSHRQTVLETGTGPDSIENATIMHDGKGKQCPQQRWCGLSPPGMGGSVGRGAPCSSSEGLACMTCSPGVGKGWAAVERPRHEIIFLTFPTTGQGPGP